MKHLGDVSKINGAEIEPAWCITFGAPCQDLSIAGKRAGMKSSLVGDDETTRSGLFFDAIRIIKEMREHEESLGKPNESVCPRYTVYENVPGCYSSNGGKDFAAVLTETIRVIQPNAPEIPVPEGGWSYAGAIMGDNWSLAWRTHDAQYWGVAQRRRRISLVTDYNGLTAPGILFDECAGREPRQAIRSVTDSLQRNFEQSGETGQRTAGDSAESVGDTSGEGGLEYF